MAYLILDTETTGLRPGYIAQLAAIRISENRVTGFNAWFKVREMDDGASKANGLTVNILNELSGGKEFYDRLDGIQALFEGVTDVYGYNTRFDRLFLETEFTRCSLPPPNAAYCDIMPDVKKIMQVKKGFKLGNAVDFFGIAEKIQPVAQKVFGAVESLHDARYDAAATFLLARKLEKL